MLAEPDNFFWTNRPSNVYSGFPTSAARGGGGDGQASLIATVLMLLFSRNKPLLAAYCPVPIENICTLC